MCSIARGREGWGGAFMLRSLESGRPIHWRHSSENYMVVEALLLGAALLQLQKCCSQPINN
eukprot:6799240-Prymnesium_polylepis.1